MLITNFSCGELSKKLNGRVDMQQYYSGASKIENFEVIPTGGIERRTGFKRMGKLHGECRLIPFIINKDISFLLEVTEGTIYIWKNGKPMLGSNNQQISIEVPYNNMAHIREIQYAQNYNEIILVHRNYTPFEIKYNIGSSSFTSGSMEFDFYPDVNMDDDYDYVIMAVDDFPAMEVRDGVVYDQDTGKAYPSGAWCIYKSKLYKYNETTEVWDHTGTDPDTDYDLFTTEGKRPGAVCFFNNRLFFASTKNDPQKVWASCTPDTEGNRYNEFSTYQKYVTVNKVIKDADLHIFTCNIKVEDIDTAANTTTLTGVTQNLTTGLEKDITKYFITNVNIPVGTKVLSVTSNTMVINTALNIEEDLEAIACTIQLWRSYDVAASEDYEMKIVENNITTSDCSFNFEIGSNENDAIKWLASGKYLSMGTESSVWESPANITALNIQAVMNGRYGSDDISALVIDTAVVYFAQGKRGIREHYWNNDQEAFQTNNIALMAEQVLTESAAVDMDYVVNPYNRLIIVREDGIAVSLLYDRTNGVLAWNRISHGKGKLTSCATTRGDKQNDLAYYVVKYGTDYYLEMIDGNNEIFLDSWSESDGTDEDYDDTAITVTIGNKTYIGYSYASDIVSLPVVANDPTGKKRITNLLIRFVDSYFPEIKVDNNDSEYFSGAEPYSGIKNVTYPGISDRDVTFEIFTDKPEKINILAINANLA